MNALLLAAALCLAAAPRPVKLVVPNAAHQPFIAAALAHAAGSPTAMKVLASLKAPVVMVIGPEKRGAYFNYDTGVVGMGREVLAEGPERAAPTIAHELTHVRQLRNNEAPSDAFEMEVEAYINDFRSHRELGIRAKPGTYDAKAQAAITAGADEFVAFLTRHYPDNVKYRDYAKYLDKAETDGLESKKKLSAELKRQRAIERTLRGRAKRNFHDENVAPLERKLREVRNQLRWYERDRKLLGPAYRAYARKIMARLRREQKKWASASR